MAFLCSRYRRLAQAHLQSQIEVTESCQVVHTICRHLDVSGQGLLRSWSAAETQRALEPSVTWRGRCDRWVQEEAAAHFPSSESMGSWHLQLWRRWHWHLLIAHLSLHFSHAIVSNPPVLIPFTSHPKTSTPTRQHLITSRPAIWYASFTLRAHLPNIALALCSWQHEEIIYFYSSCF